MNTLFASLFPQEPITRPSQTASFILSSMADLTSPNHATTHATPPSTTSLPSPPLSPSKQPSVSDALAIKRILKCVTNHIPPSTFYLALLLVKKSISYNSEWSSTPPSLLFGIALLVAHKVNDDITYRNTSWSKIMNVNVSIINHMEREMLTCLGYNAHVTKSEYAAWLRVLMANYNGRGIVDQDLSKWD